VTVVDGVECSTHHANARSLGYHKDLVLSPGAAALVRTAVCKIAI
jgi:hypothetical protein